jgi:putative DNA primase/helicase
MARFTDSWNAERFAESNQWKARWVPEWRNWIVWNKEKGFWELGDSGEVLNLATDTVRGWVEEGDCMDEKTLKKFENWLEQGEGLGRLEAMTKLARARLKTRACELDAQLWMTNFENGTYDFKNDKLVKHDPKYLMTTISPVKYDPNIKYEDSCPVFIRFLNEIMCDRQELVDYLQKIFGSCLVGKVLDRTFYIWKGDGYNGKSTLANIWMNLLGDNYSVKLPSSTFIKDPFENKKGVTPDIDKLPGKRLAITSEIEEGAKLAIAKVKEMTGRVPISVNPKYRDAYSFIPQATFIMDTNPMPEFDGTDEALMSRLRVIPFDYVVPFDKVDTELEDKIKEEWSGILNWGIEGFRKWNDKKGLRDAPPIVMFTVKKYQKEGDPLAKFLESGCLRKAEGKTVETKKMLEVYNSYAENAGLPVLKYPKKLIRWFDTPKRNIDGLEIIRLDKIAGQRGGGFMNVAIVDILDIEGEEKVKSMGSEFAESYGKQQDLDLRERIDEVVDDDDLENNFI